jgi:tetratricopeptide (TPR) repeat protein
MKNSLATMSTTALLAMLVSLPSFAQDAERAVQAFQQARYEDAAVHFDAVLRFAEDAGDVAEAQYGIAASFQKLKLNIASYKYYEDIVRVGADHPYFDKAIEGLIDLADVLQDELKIPAILDGTYDDNASAINKMSSELRQRMHYLIGRHLLNRKQIRDAREFLNTVKRGNQAYPHAQYLLGLIRLGVGRDDSPKPRYDRALRHFENVREVIPLDVTDERLRELRDLATLGIARIYYEEAYQLEEEDPKRSEGLRLAIYEYRQIPRFSDAWSDALLERAWAHTVYNEYGKALGALHSLRAPYFEDSFYPEAEILTAIIYYYNCQWDRVNGVLDRAKAEYTPLAERILTLSEEAYDFDEWYALLAKSLEAGRASTDERLIPYPVAVYISQDARFRKLESYLRQLEKEADVFRTSSSFSRGEMGREMAEFALETRDAFLQIVGKYVQAKLISTGQELNAVTTRVGLVSLETKTAETEWLEQGREIGGQVRKRLPRPFVPDDTFQFWWFRSEYWVDELGYFEYKIKTECFE